MPLYTVFFITLFRNISKHFKILTE
jgi:hypothetical protein